VKKRKILDKIAKKLLKKETLEREEFISLFKTESAFAGKKQV